MDLSPSSVPPDSFARSGSFAPCDEGASGAPALLAAAAARAAATTTALVQARMPVRIEPVDAAFDVAAAAAMLAQRRSGRDRRVNDPFTEPL